MRTKTDSDEPQAEYDFSQGERGKHFRRYRRGTNLVRLDDDVAERFPTSAAVNRALRSVPTPNGKSRKPD